MNSDHMMSKGTIEEISEGVANLVAGLDQILEEGLSKIIDKRMLR